MTPIPIFLVYWCGYKNGSSDSITDTTSGFEFFSEDELDMFLDILESQDDIDLCSYTVVPWEEVYAAIHKELQEDTYKNVYVGGTTTHLLDHTNDNVTYKQNWWVFKASNEDGARKLLNYKALKLFEPDPSYSPFRKNNRLEEEIINNELELAADIIQRVVAIEHNNYSAFVEPTDEGEYDVYEP